MASMIFSAPSSGPSISRFGLTVMMARQSWGGTCRLARSARISSERGWARGCEQLLVARSIGVKSSETRIFRFMDGVSQVTRLFREEPAFLALKFVGRTVHSPDG